MQAEHTGLRYSFSANINRLGKCQSLSATNAGISSNGVGHVASTADLTSNFVLNVTPVFLYSVNVHRRSHREKTGLEFSHKP